MYIRHKAFHASSLPPHKESVHSLLHEVIVYELGHDGDGRSAGALVENLCNVFVLDSNHVLPIHFTQVVVYEQTIAGGRGGRRDEGEERRKGGEKGSENFEVLDTRVHYRYLSSTLSSTCIYIVDTLGRGNLAHYRGCPLFGGKIMNANNHQQGKLQTIPDLSCDLSCDLPGSR